VKENGKIWIISINSDSINVPKNSDLLGIKFEFCFVLAHFLLV
jgi:hypothetical protein